MKLVKVKFLKENKPYGRAYTYQVPANIVVQCGDTVQINEHSKVIVVETNVPESEVAAFKDKLKCIVGLATPYCYESNEDTLPLCKGNGSEQCNECSLWQDLEQDDVE